MRTLLLIVAGNVVFLAWELRRTLPEIREHNFELIREAAAKCVDAGWVPMRVSWHGLFRTRPHMEMEHREHPYEFTLRYR